MRAQGWTPELQWIPSHCGIPGNEIADRIANAAHILDITDYPVETDEINVVINNKHSFIRKQIWNIEKHRCPLGNIKDKIEPWTHTRHPKRALDVVLTRFRVNHTKLNKHMFAKGLVDSPNCKQCNLNVNEDVEHVLLNCPTYQENRDTLKTNLSYLGIQNLSLKNLLGGANKDDSTLKLITKEVGVFLEKSVRIKDL